MGGVTLFQTLVNEFSFNKPFFLLTSALSDKDRDFLLRSGIADVFLLPLDQEAFALRIGFLLKQWHRLQHPAIQSSYHSYKTPLVKRIFDIVFSGAVLLLLTPLFLLVAILLKLESKGPVFYYALRVGTGYQTFKFYKFRSMYVNADQRLKDLKHLNQYAPTTEIESATVAADNVLCADCAAKGSKCRFPIYADKIEWCEKKYMDEKKSMAGSAFFKLKDDPRITRVGKFIRNTSIDELPQLWNVMIGDMSIVGNRPLPLYEAEKLTTDKYAMRFLAPAGITGLWQVEKRGKGEMSEEERLELDNLYAKNHSFLNDIRLILKTIPALFQSESV
ncbi:MAG: sugar transferase [Sphingobacteriia bacterium]|nr:MAG: sugar transferase [Sphingobacteriia bacterium]